MKKTLSVSAVLVVCLLLLMLCLTACNGGKEYQLTIDDNMKANIIDDNYRTYYEIFVGGFSDSNEDGVGDLRGVINRLNYLNDGDPNSGKSLGITGIWLMPIMWSTSYHKYDVIDYKVIDPSYGTMDDMRELVKEAHARGINIIIDLVLNHTSKYHDWFIAAQNARKSGDTSDPYYDFYTVRTGNASNGWYDFATDPNGVKWVYEGNFSSDMPELNYDNPAVKDAIEDVVKFWLQDVGIDGFRLDAVKYFYYGSDAKNIELLTWLNQTCKKYNSDAYLIGENWSDQNSIYNYYQAINCFDFPFSEVEGKVVAAAKGGLGTLFGNSVVSYYNAVKSKNPDAIMAPFLSNHDMDRSAGYLNMEDKSLQLASSMYLLMPGNPYIYYGEEIGMKGSRGTASTDANRRLAMLWGDKDTVKNPVGASYTEDSQTNGTVRSQLGKENSIYNHYKKVIALRNANPEIARGQVSSITTFGDSICVLKYVYNGSTVYVIHNMAAIGANLDLSSFGNLVLSGWTTAEATLSGSQLTMGAFGSAVVRVVG